MTRKKSIQQIAKIYGLKLLLLFGSRSDGTARPNSDFDIAYYSQKNLTLDEEARMMLELTPHMKSENIDLVNMKNAPPLLFYHIFKHPKIFYAKDMYFFYNMRVYAFKKCVEAKPLFAMRSDRLMDIIVHKKKYDV